MKKLFLFLLAVLFFIVISTSAFAKDCQVARPWFGSINCENTGTWSDPIGLSDGNIWECNVPNCIIDSLSQSDWDCGWGGIPARGITIKDANTGVTLIKCQNAFKLAPPSESCDVGGFPYPLTIGKQIKVDFWCYNLVDYWNPSDNPKVNVKYEPIMLKLHYDSGEKFVSNTEYCNINPVWNEYYLKQPSNPSSIQTMSSNIITDMFTKTFGTSIPSGTIGALQPNNLNVPQGYWLVYDWVIRPNLIVKDYQGMPVWCNSIDHSLIKFEEIDTNSGECYLIPTQRLSQIADCCVDDECKLTYNEQAIYCTDDFRCGYEKSCLSDFDCGATASTCQAEGGNYYLVKSVCDKSKTDDYGKGKCVSTKEQVKCCTGQDGGPNTCGYGYYCEYSTGCQEILQKCPTGKCCEAGGKYIPQSCSSGLQCCRAPNSFVGDCKETCEPVTQQGGAEQQIGVGSGIPSTGPLGPTGGFLLGDPTLLIGTIVGIVAGVIIIIFFLKKKKREFKSLRSGKGKRKRDLLGGEI